MLKIEMKFNEQRIIEDGKYSVSSIYDTLDKIFGKYQFRKEVDTDGSVTFYGNGKAKDYGIFGRIITTLKDKKWFMNYLDKWLWYNSDDGDDEEDYNIEDILYHYTKKESAA